MDFRAQYLHDKLDNLTPKDAFILGRYIGMHEAKLLPDYEFLEVFDRHVINDYLRYVSLICQVKNSSTNMKEFIQSMQSLYPPSIYTHEHQMLDLIKSYSGDYLSFVNEYHNNRKLLSKLLIESSWCKSLRQQPVKELLEKHRKNKKHSNTYYRPENKGKQFYSLDLRHAICTVLFLSQGEDIPCGSKRFYADRDQMLANFKWSDLIQANWESELPNSKFWMNLFSNSKYLRERVMGDICALSMDSGDCIVGKYYEMLLDDLMTSISNLQPPESVIYQGGDEIILTKEPILPEGWLSKYIKVESFTLEVYQLQSKKYFYVRQSILKMVDFQNRLEALRIAGLSQ